MKTFDFNLHGLARIRLLTATSEDAAMVGRQLGLPPSTPTAEPDILIRFVDDLPGASSIRLLGLDDAGFTDDAFVVLRSKHKSRAKVQIPFHDIGNRCEIVCERNLLQVPLLIPMLNLTVLSKGALALHASAFIYGGEGLLATGWSKGGKTETLLAFMANGATYVGDEWVYLTGDGKHMYGVPEPIRVWKWHLDELGRYRDVVSRAERARLRALELVVQGIERLAPKGSARTSPARRSLNRVKSLFGKQLCIDVSPYELFGRAACRAASVPEKILFVVSHESPEVTVRPIDPREVCARMVASLQYEQMSLMSYYWKFRFAFPQLSNDLIEESADLQHEILNRVLEGREAYEVRHPYPVSIPSLFEAITEQCLRT